MVNERWQKRKHFIKTCTSTLSKSNLDKLHDAGFLSDINYSIYVEWESHVNDSTDDWYIEQGFVAKEVKTPEARKSCILESIRDYSGVMKFTKKETIYDDISKELKKIPLRDRLGLSDVFEGATKCKIYAGAGHGASYWNHKQADLLAIEAFANMGSAYMNVSDSHEMEMFKKWIPKSTAVFEDMLKELGKKGETK